MASLSTAYCGNVQFSFRSEPNVVVVAANKAYLPAIPCPPTSAIDTAGVLERELYVESISTLPGLAPPLSALHQMWLRACRAAATSSSSDPNHANLLVKAKTLDEGLKLWWEEVHGTSGAVNEFERQAEHAVSFLLLCRYGDYAAQILNDLKETVNKKVSYLKPLYKNKQWTDIAKEIEAEEVRIFHPVLLVTVSVYSAGSC
jgi:hypothetical protein